MRIEKNLATEILKYLYKHPKFHFPSLLRWKEHSPQVRVIKKVLAMLSYIGSGINSKSELFGEFDVTDRQIDYYLNVLARMNICVYKRDEITLTERWNEIFNMTSEERLQAMAKIIFSNRIFNDALDKWIEGINDKDFEEWKMSTDVTKERRKKTIRSWISFFRSMLLG